MEVTVRTFDETEWAIYRDLRLAALEDSPDAFGGTLAQSSQRADSVWQSRLLDGLSCPIPPKENWLDFPIPAGEKAYH
jgi:hypothetical protein